MRKAPAHGSDTALTAARGRSSAAEARRPDRSDVEAGPAGPRRPVAALRGRRRTAAGAALAALLAAGAAGCASTGSGSQGAAASPSSSGVTASASSAATGAGTPAGGASAGASSGGAGANAQAGGNTACGASQLRVTTAEAGAAAGHLGMVLLFANTGSASCTLDGYPGAALSGPGGSTLLNAQRTVSGYLGGAQSVGVVTVAAGASASALLEWSDVPAGSGCPGAGATALLVTPPNTTATTSLAPINEVCSGFQIHPVVSGTTGRSGT